jgi:hypothetical protein
MDLRLPVTLSPALSVLAAIPAATVYVVMGTDTSSITNAAGQDVQDAGEFNITFDMTPMSAGVFTTIMTDAFRESHTDSRGDPMVFTWWMLTGGWHQPAINVDAVAATRVYQDHWREPSDRWGDEIALHYHNFLWTGNDWVQAPTFTETLWDFEWSISQLVLDCDVMPVSYRSGWNWMSDPYQQTLERWIPFRLEGGSWMSQDVPYHPSVTNYRQPGTMRGWEVRHRYLSTLTQGQINQVFDWAAAGQDQVTCLWSHQYESDFLSRQVENSHAFLQAADASHPGVEFRYVTAHDGMRIWQGSDDVASPPLSLTPSGGALQIFSESDIFQIAQPYVAARLRDDSYIRLEAQANGPGSWEIDPIPPNVDLLGVAVSDLMGNATIRQLRDGSRRWSSQTELSRMTLEQVDALSVAGQATLARNETSAAIEQLEDDQSTPIIRRAYWIGQTFTPTQAGLSKISIGVKVNQAPSTVRVELREVGDGGFPVMSEAGLLVSGEASAIATGDLEVDLPFNGFTLDGRQYALVFLREAGDFEVLLHTTGSYGGGNLVRAYSLDWIHIPAFDCRFQTFDQVGSPNQGQATSDGDAFNHETGHFVSQTFLADFSRIDAIEVMVDASAGSDVLSVQLRRTMPDGSPDLSHGALIGEAGATASGPGILGIDTGWTIPVVDHGTILALTFVSPQTGGSSIALARSTGDELPNGALYLSTDTEATQTSGDLWVRLLSASHAPLGSLTWDFDAESVARWTGGNWEAQLPSGAASIQARASFADTSGGLDAAAWTPWVTASPFALPASAESRWARFQVELATGDGSVSPILEAFEVLYEPGDPISSVSGLHFR